MWKGEFQGKV